MCNIAADKGITKTLKRKVHTLITNPIGVLVKYSKWNRMVARLRGILPPFEDENYDKHWNYLNFKGKTVLDLGADYGSTASYFLWRGAKQIVAVEGNKEITEKLRQTFLGDSRVTPIELFIKTPEDIDNLISKYSPDIVKVDIEGYETNLLGCRYLQKVKEWLVECHNPEVHEQIKNLFLRKGFEVATIEYGITCGSPNVTILVARSI